MSDALTPRCRPNPALFKCFVSSIVYWYERVNVWISIWGRQDLSTENPRATHVNRQSYMSSSCPYVHDHAQSSPLSPWTRNSCRYNEVEAENFASQREQAMSCVFKWTSLMCRCSVRPLNAFPHVGHMRCSWECLWAHSSLLVPKKRPQSAQANLGARWTSHMCRASIGAVRNLASHSLHSCLDEEKRWTEKRRLRNEWKNWELWKEKKNSEREGRQRKIRTEK